MRLTIRRNNKPARVRPSLVSLVKGWWNAEPSWPKGKSKKKLKRGEDKIEYVYLFTDATGLYKIGRTNNLRRRTTSRTRSPSLRIVGYIPSPDSRRLEKGIHKDLKDFRLEGSEWFRLDLTDRQWKYWFSLFQKDIDQRLLDDLNLGAYMREGG